MKRQTIFGILALLAGVAVNAQGFGPAATINSVEIARLKVQMQSDHLVNQRGLGSGGITQPSAYRAIQEEIVERLIVQELLWQEAQRRGIVAGDDEVQAQLDKMKGGFENEMAFQFSIKEGGFTEETFRENIRQQRSVQNMIAGDITNSIVIDDTAVEQFYTENKDKMGIEEQIRARHILIKATGEDSAAKAVALEKIAVIQKRLDAGESFALVAIETSEGPSGSKGGDLGLFGRGQMVAAFEEVAFALQPGEVSGPVETQFGIHLIKLEERVAAETVPLETASPRIREYLSQQELYKSVETLITDLRETGDVKIHLW
jgi:peptidyl-prolyl cis-trans isomerase C